MDQAGFLGTGASLKSDLSLMAYLLLIIPAMLTGFVFARRKMFVPHHKLMMTSIIIVNWVIIFFLMAVSYREGVSPYLGVAFSDPRVALPTIHLVTGAVAQILGTYLVLRMWFEKVLPKWIMVRNIKTYMRFTLALWLITAALGIIIYAAWYVRPAQAGNAPAPASTPEVSGTPELNPGSTEEAFSAPLSTQEAISEPLSTESVQPPCPTPEVTDSGDATPEAGVPAGGLPANVVPAATEEPCLTPVATEDISPVETEEADSGSSTETSD